MKVVRIFVSDNSADGIWSIHFPHETQNEFDKFFDSMNNPEWVHDFFEKNNVELSNGFFGNISIGEAVIITLEEAQEMEYALYQYAKQGFDDGYNKLQYFFKPLNNFEYIITLHQKSKLRIHKGWLRLYAIRLRENCYLVTGGAVKLTKDMKTEHLQTELKKLTQVIIFLRDNGIDYPEDLNTYKDE